MLVGMKTGSMFTPRQETTFKQLQSLRDRYIQRASTEWSKKKEELDPMEKLPTVYDISDADHTISDTVALNTNEKINLPMPPTQLPVLNTKLITHSARSEDSTERKTAATNASINSNRIEQLNRQSKPQQDPLDQVKNKDSTEATKSRPPRNSRSNSTKQVSDHVCSIQDQIVKKMSVSSKESSNAPKDHQTGMDMRLSKEEDMQLSTSTASAVVGWLQARSDVGGDSFHSSRTKSGATTFCRD